MTRTPEDITDLAYSDSVGTWLDQLPGMGSTAKGVGYFVREARSAAEEFVRLGCVYVDLCPGDGTSYKMWLLDTERHAVEAGDDVSGLRNTVIVAMPRVGKSCMLAVDGYHMPYYIEEKTRLTMHECTVIAGFTTLFGAAVAEVRS